MAWEKPSDNLKIEPSFGDQDTVGKPGEVREFHDRKFRWQDSGYSLRQYYSHDGPGWDFRQPILDKYNVDEAEELPDDIRIYSWEEILDDDK